MKILRELLNLIKIQVYYSFSIYGKDGSNRIMNLYIANTDFESCDLTTDDVQQIVKDCYMQELHTTDIDIHIQKWEAKNIEI